MTTLMYNLRKMTESLKGAVNCDAGWLVVVFGVVKKKVKCLILSFHSRRQDADEW